jgi:hypothetical protein
MKTNKFVMTMALVAMLFMGVTKANAQVNAQLFYDFGNDREWITLTLEMFKQDKWGSTYFFVDHDFYYQDPRKDGNKRVAPGQTYTEIARALNFWQNTKLKDLSLHAEYNGGIGNINNASRTSYPIYNAWLFGLEYFLHDKAYKNTLNLEVLYKTIRVNKQAVPMQFTAVWACNDLFGAKGLKFDGFADLWWETHTVYDKDSKPSEAKTVFITEPQVWYRVGQHFGVPNLNVGTEIELSANFGSTKGFKCRPCLGVKWDF